VAALLLARAGYRVSAVFIKSWEEDDRPGECAAAADAEDAARVAEQLGVPLRRVNFAPEYWDRVFDRFLSDQQAGLTPNPDIGCNREIKFRSFLEHALAGGADRIATGHHARLAREGNRFRLLKGHDPEKDQSYFLYTLGQEALARTLFPVGELTKPEVRRIAAAAGLVTHAKPGSTGICFVGERPFREFLGRFLPSNPGQIRTLDGTVLGTHGGLHGYTIGQRQGLGIGGRRGAKPGPWYVVAKDLEHNALVVAQGHGHPVLMSLALDAGELHWVGGAPPAGPLTCQAKVRYRQSDQACRVTPLPGERCRVDFATAQRAVTPGQSVVFYDGQECLGGGVIERAIPSTAPS
jgi:tRNA-specific 2-thiouridylase